MSDEKQAKEVKDEELDKVSGGTGEHSMGTGRHEEDTGHHRADSAGGHHNVFSTGVNKTK